MSERQQLRRDENVSYLHIVSGIIYFSLYDLNSGRLILALEAIRRFVSIIYMYNENILIFI